MSESRSSRPNDRGGTGSGGRGGNNSNGRSGSGSGGRGNNSNDRGGSSSGGRGGNKSNGRGGSSSGGRSGPPGRGGRPSGSGSGGRSGPPNRGGSGSGAGGRGSGGRPRGDRFTPKWREEQEAMTAAERRAAEIDARRTTPRLKQDADMDRRRADERSTEEWIDEGSVRDAAIAATDRAATPTQRREPRPLDPEIGEQLVDVLGDQRGKRLSERLAQAADALDRERFDEARRVSAAIAKEAPDIAAVQEVLGLASYRLGRYKQAATALQRAQELHADPNLLPVIADCYRALRRWQAVERVWDQIKAASPPHEVMTEGRIIYASSLADRGDLPAAIAALDDGTKSPKRVRDHHLRQWYVLGDFYDRMGDTINARRYFATVADHDHEFVDVVDRLRALGR